MEIIWRVISWEEERGREGEKVQGIRRIIGRYKIGRGISRIYSIGNGEAKELICMTHGYELKGEIAGGKGVTRQRGAKGENWDNCNGIINKMYFLKRSSGWCSSVD